MQRQKLNRRIQTQRPDTAPQEMAPDTDMRPRESETGLREECGVFGVYNPNGGDVAKDLYYGLAAGIPDSGLVAAMGYAGEAGIPFGLIFHKNSYVGRTFLKPTALERESSVKIKLSVLEPAVQVPVRICSPPFLYPCYFGTDVPSNKQLIASSHSVEEICRTIGADSLGYMQAGALSGMAGGLPLCTACFTGRYPMEVPDCDIKSALENCGCR